MVKRIDGMILACVWDRWYWLDNRAKWQGPFASEELARGDLVKKM